MSFERLGFLGSSESLEGSKACVLGFPYDRTSSFRSGSRFAPNDIRRISQWNFESFDPVLNEDLESYVYCDLGDMDIESGIAPEAFLDNASIFNLKGFADLLDFYRSCRY